MLQLTEKAAEKVRYFAETMPEANGKALRIFIEGGGCSGFQYGFTFDDRQDGDTVIEAHGITVLVDPLSAQYLTGATVDFIEDFRGSGFVVENPNAVRSCGCGHSCAVE
ncbi:MAG: iron-sulfur cluster insertion protein ErpA [Thermoanaerobaculaceae bacterium]